MLDREHILSRLGESGYWQGVLSEPELTVLIPILGEPDPVETLISRDGTEANLNTLSKTYGLSAFPLHTDDIQSKLPAKYLLLRNVWNGHLANTLLSDLDDALNRLPEPLLREAFEAPFLIRSGQYSRYLKLTERRSGGQRVNRFNKDVMTPAGARSRRVWASFFDCLGQARVIEIVWRPGETLVIDNHRMAHGRKAINNSQRRILQRCLIR